MFDNLVDINIDKEMAEAVRKGDIASIKDALSRGADIHELGSGIPYPMIAAKEKKWDALIFLFKSGAYRDTMDRRGWTPTHLAAEFADAWVLKELKELDVELNGQDFMVGETPLMVAIKNGKKEITKFLITEAGIALNTKDNEGKTALHIAAQLGDKETFMLLVENRAKLHIVDKSGKIASDYIEDIDWKMSLPQIERIAFAVQEEKPSEQVEDKKDEVVDEVVKPKVSGLSRIKKKK